MKFRRRFTVRMKVIAWLAGAVAVLVTLIIDDMAFDANWKPARSTVAGQQAR